MILEDDNSDVETDQDEVKSEEEIDNEGADEENASEESASEENSNNDEGVEMNAGWADSVAKILKSNKPKGKKTLVLSKAKKLTDPHTPKPAVLDFQIDGSSTEVKEEKPDPLQLLDAVKQDPDTGEPTRKKRKEIPSVRVKPDIIDRTRERTLAKIATRGVVQLFNAVRTQQKDISHRLEEAGPLERKKEQVLKSIDKREFLNVLMGGEQSRSQAVDGPVKHEGPAPSSTPGWSVLREDFMLPAKFKDWDKEET